MSTHSYSRLWIHLIWETLAREPMLDKGTAARTSVHLSDYALEKGIYMKINYFNADHTHALFDLPTSKSIEEVVQLFKGNSSHWINENKLVTVCLGTRIWSILGLTFRCRTRGTIHCGPGETPQKEEFCRGV